MTAAEESTGQPAVSPLALAVFRAWVRLTCAPFDAAAHRLGARAHPLQDRPVVRHLCRRLVRTVPAMRLVTPPAPARPPAGSLPRQIWFYWDQGESAAPDLVRHCIDSWKSSNPDWRVTCLDARSPLVVASLAGLPADLGAAHRADILRLKLLSEHGGVWADASVLCRRPLDEWLTRRMQAGFFAFGYREPQADRPLANWFLASEPRGYLITNWLRHVLAYWSVDTRPVHYFVHHYLFDWMLLTDPLSAARWQGVPHVPAGPMHVLQGFFKKRRPASDVFKILADPDMSPLLKLDWRMDVSVDEIIRFTAQDWSEACNQQ